MALRPVKFKPFAAGGRLPQEYELSDGNFEAIRKLIYREAGLALNGSKRALVCARLAKRLRHLNLKTHGEYLEYLAHRDPRGDECQEMINCLTTNKTDFFREPHHFEHLRTAVFPEIEHRTRIGAPRRLRIWSAGCSTGDEPYSLAMEVLACGAFDDSWDVRILASDISTQVLRLAEEGLYPTECLEPVPQEWRERFFVSGADTPAGCVRAAPELKRLIAFRRINLVDRNWPVRTKFDVILCRNVIIYFDRPTQQRLLRRLASHLVEGGYLMLGHSESPAWLADIMTPLGKTIYRLGAYSDWRPKAAAVAADPASHVGDRISAAASGAAARSKPQGALRGHAPWREVPGSSSSHAPALPRRQIVAGEVFASNQPTEISTLLGSCVAACLFDPQRAIGGMNHFMLPCQSEDIAASARYGVHAMELLINEIMKLGGDRRRLQAKVFGGANVLRFSDFARKIGDMNIAFVRGFLQTDGIPIVAERLGGQGALRIHFVTSTGKAYVRTLPRSRNLIESEQVYARRATEDLQPSPDTVTLF